jgi:hypothetical protein
MQEFKTLLRESPLYETTKMAPADAVLLLWSIQEELVSFDSYCPECKAETTWRVVAPIEKVLAKISDQFRADLFHYLKRWLNHMEFTCARDRSHVAQFGIDATLNTVRDDTRGAISIRSVEFRKFGQLPSLADIAASELDAYREFINAADLKELNRAVGLAAHGIGIGSFVYLRRIFERLVAEAADRAVAADAAFDRDGYKTLRMEDKLEAVRGFIPDWMVENRKLYGILSVGLHELTDDGCMTAFPAVKQATLALLEQHAVEARRAKRAAQAAIDLAQLGETLARKK